jgi:hypothetical protein
MTRSLTRMPRYPPQPCAQGQPLLGGPPDLVDDLGSVAGRDGGHGNPLRPRHSTLSSEACGKELWTAARGVRAHPRGAWHRLRRAGS